MIAAAGAVLADSRLVTVPHELPEIFHLGLRRPILRVLHAVAREERDPRCLVGRRDGHEVVSDGLVTESRDLVGDVELRSAARDADPPAHPRCAIEGADDLDLPDMGNGSTVHDESQPIRGGVRNPESDVEGPLGDGALPQMKDGSQQAAHRCPPEARPFCHRSCVEQGRTPAAVSDWTNKSRAQCLLSPASRGAGAACRSSAPASTPCRD